jgi:hypothetical protein
VITPSFSLTATERVLPRLALDFTTASLDPRVTFTRTGNTATVVNSSGVIAPINADLPRFDFDPVTLVCKGLLIEEARTNFATRSGDMSLTTPWYTNGATNFTRVQNAITAPDGTLTATQIVVTANGTISGNADYAGLGAAGGTTFSFFVKKGSSATLLNTFLVRNTTTATNLLNISINYDTGVITNNIGSGCSSVKYADGWWRVIMPAITGVNAGDTLRFYPALSGVSLTAGDNFYIWGGQFEKAAFATSYIPTVASTVARNADVATMTGTNFSSWYNATEGAFFIEATNFHPPKYQPILRIDGGAITDSVYFDIDSSAARMVAFVGGANQCVIGTSALTANTKFKIVGAIKLNSYAASLNAGSVGTDNSATVPTVNRLLLGNDGVNIFNGIYAKVNYYPQRLINAEVQAFSK